jgi:fucose 4-O-acetylase-like acetyltransferase
MALLIYIIALVITVLLMKVADLVHSTAGDIRIAVFLGILFIVNWILGMVPMARSRRAP